MGEDANPVSPSLGDILNFIASEFRTGRCYRSLNCYRSALSSVLAPIDGFDVGRHILDHITSWGVNESLSLQRLSWKLAMLLALTSASRSSDLSNLTIANHRFSKNGLVLYPSGLSKQSRAGHTPSPWEVKGFSGNNLLCPVQCFRDYQEATESARSLPGHDRLFLAVKKPHSPVTSSTIARWLKAVLNSAGVNTSQFSAHSTRGAAASAAAMAGVTTKQILATADWASAGTFKKFYLREISSDNRAPRQGFDVGLLSHSSASKSRCDIEPEPDEMQSKNG